MDSSKSFPVTAVVAMTPGGVIGLDGSMPWRLRQDLQRFKKLTMGGVLVMGRKTYQSIGRPLPGRRTIVVSRSPDQGFNGVEMASSPQAALQLGRGRHAGARLPPDRNPLLPLQVSGNSG